MGFFRAGRRSRIAGAPSPLMEEGSTPTVGRLLKDERVRHGLSLEEVSASLRIRRILLEAIEEGDLSALPGPTYAIGFVRGYAEYLSLDGEELVRRFRAEAQGLDQPIELHFPAPISQGRLPGGAIMMASVVLAAIAYGSWYYATLQVRQPLEQVPPLPERLIVPGSERPAPSSANAEAAIVPIAPPSTPVPPANVATLPPATAVPATGSPATAPATMAPATTAPAPPSASPSAASASPVPPDTARIGAAVPVPAPAPTSAQPPAPTQVASQSPAPAPAPATTPDTARASGEAQGDSRVVLRASQDSWIQIRDSVGQIVFMRTLKPGETYAVPNRPGLQLATGNAGGLDILVDGKPTPPLGRPGYVRREVALDPVRLQAGTAAPEPTRPTPPSPVGGATGTTPGG